MKKREIYSFFSLNELFLRVTSLSPFFSFFSVFIYLYETPTRIQQLFNCLAVYLTLLLSFVSLSLETCSATSCPEFVCELLSFPDRLMVKLFVHFHIC